MEGSEMSNTDPEHESGLPEVVTVVDDDAETEANAWFNSFIQDAVDAPGDHGIPHQELHIWSTEAELTRLREGREFCNRHKFALALILAFTLIPFFAVHRSAGIFFRREWFVKSPTSAFKGLMATYWHLLKWLGSGIEDKDGEIVQDVYRARQIHAKMAQKLQECPDPPAPQRMPKKCKKNLFEAMRADLEYVPTPEYVPALLTSTPAVPISQFDLSLSLSLTFYLLDINPSAVGIYSDEGYESYVHMIGIIGRVMGIADRFNVALHPRPSVRRAVSKRVMDLLLAPCFKNSLESEFMNICHIGEGVVPVVDVVPMFLYMTLKDVLGCSSPSHTWANLNIFCRLLYGLGQIAIWLVRYRPILWLTNLVVGYGNWLLIRWELGWRKPENNGVRDIQCSGCPV